MISHSTLQLRTLVALVVVATLSLAACGTRLDREDILAAGSGFSSGTGPGGTGAAPGMGGVPTDGAAIGADGAAVPGAGADPAAAGGSTSAAGPGGAGGSGGPGSSNPGSPGGSGGPPIVIGTVGTYSGPVGAAQAQAPKALQAWAAAINAKGGINGRKVQVLVYDDAGDGSKARSQVRELIEQRKGVAVVSAMASASLPPIRSYAEQKKVPVIGGPCSDVLWNQSPMLFTNCSSIESNAYGMVATGAKYGKGKKWGSLVCTETSGCTYAEELWFDKGYAKQAGLEPVYRARISLASPDYTSECLQARNAGVQLFTVLSDPNTLLRVVSSCRRQGFNPQYLVIPVSVRADTPSHPGLSDLIMLSPTFPFVGLSSPAAQEFQAAWKKYGGGGALDGSASLGWASAKLFEKAARAAGNDLTTAGILKGLYTLRNERHGGLTVPLSFVPNKPAPDAGCWFVMLANSGKWTAPQGDRLDCRR